MKTFDMPRLALLGGLVVVLALLLGGACVPQDMAVSPLGTVVVGAGEDIQIRSLEVLTGIGVRGIPRQRAVAMALAGLRPDQGAQCDDGGGAGFAVHGGRGRGGGRYGDRRRACGGRDWDFVLGGGG